MRLQRNDAGKLLVKLTDEDIAEITERKLSFNTDRLPDIRGINIKKITLDYSIIIEGSDGNHLFNTIPESMDMTTINGEILFEANP